MNTLVTCVPPLRAGEKPVNGEEDRERERGRETGKSETTTGCASQSISVCGDKCSVGS